MAYTVAPFSATQLHNDLTAPPCILDDAAGNPRANYLFEYFAHLGANTIVTELEYIDADYLDDFASFYVKSFAHISNRCRRLHFFTNQFDEAALGQMVRREPGTCDLQDHYLGFVVARPLPSAMIGRTVVRTYPPDGVRRCYTCLRPYSVNLFGIELKLDSLAFQEQDTSLAACATVALWSCFQKTRDMFHSGSPSPVLITRAANRILRSARPFPSRGLTIEQVCNAIASVGLDPEVYSVQPDIPLVSLAYSYLKLGVPVMLIFSVPNVGLHGVALNGYSLRDSVQLPREGGSAVLPALIGRRIDEFYCHDDQAGPFSRLKVIPASDDSSIVKFTATNWQGELSPYAVVVPVYPKIRTGFREVISNWIPRLSLLLSFIRSAPEFEWDIFLTSSNWLKSDIRANPTAIPSETRAALLVECLPKYLWRCTLRIARSPALEMLLDTTEMVRGFPVLRIWWPDENLKAQLTTSLFDPRYQDGFVQLLTRRLFTQVYSSLT